MEVAEKSNSSGTPDFTGENTLERETLCFFGSSGLWGHRSRVSVSAAGSGLDVGKSWTKKAQRTVAELDLHFKMLKRGQPWSTFGRSGRQNVHETVARARFVVKFVKTGTFRAARHRPHCQRCANIGRFGATLLLCGCAAGCGRTHWHGCAQQSTSDAAGLLAPGKQDCSWSLPSAL